MSAQPTSAGSMVNEELLVYHVSLFILAFIALLFVSRLPRACLRLSRWSEISQGHLFTTSHIRNTTRIVQVTPDHTPSPISPSTDDESTDDTHSQFTFPVRVNEKGAMMTMDYPPHIASCPSFLRGVTSELIYRLIPGYSLSQAICALFYAAAWVYPAFYKSNPLAEFARTGWIAVAQLPFIFAFAAKNSVLGPFLGLGYEKLNFMHRLAGRVFVVAVNVHSIGFIYMWTINGNFKEKIAIPSHYWGFVGFIFTNFVFFFATEWWRKKAYNFFLAGHIAGFPVLLAGTWMHKEADKPFVLAALVLYSFDHLARCIKTRIHTATIRPIPELGATRIEVPQINAGWRAGQHVRLRIFSSGMGWFGWSEVHPFTIASASHTAEGMVLMVKKSGTWTTKLFDMAKAGQYSEAGIGSHVNVMLEGPYGGPGHAIPASHSAAVFVIGGSGITYALSAIQELVQKDLRGQSRVKIIELIWIVQDPAALVPLVPQLSAIIQQSVFTPVRISVFYTRAVIGKFPFPKDFFHPRLSLSPGRPKIAMMLESTISKTVTLGAGVKDKEGHSGMMVAVCGPTSLSDDVAEEVGKIDPTRRDQVGGVELLEDVFGF